MANQGGAPREEDGCRRAIDGGYDEHRRRKLVHDDARIIAWRDVTDDFVVPPTHTLERIFDTAAAIDDQLLLGTGDGKSDGPTERT